jgi:hypothetical protein
LSAKPTKEPVSPGHDAYSRARGVPVNRPKLISRDFVSDPRGSAEIRAPHGIAVKDNRTKPKR